ncbi:MAG: 4Fe-4S dicluster domain-containing protein [Elusimicrobia bacterium]|nr:4Fe-4S dicluster domain-containing protein [Elusimicrobiota bacterium]
MAHHIMKSGYAALADRLDRYPQGIARSELLFRILRVLFSEKEAGLVSLLPIKPFTAGTAAAAWKLPLAETRNLLDALAQKALLLDTESYGETTYVLPPPMAGFFEFSLMRTRGDIDQKALSELFRDYLNVEEEFIKNLFTPGETQFGRVFVHEPALPADNGLHVLDYEKASEVIRTAAHRGVGLCYCRHKARHLGKACGAPLELCLTFDSAAESLVRHGFARAVGVQEGLAMLRQAYDLGLVQFGENVRNGVNFICNCCGCCCEAMLAARRFGTLHPVHTTNFLPEVDARQCTGCGRCVRACPVNAMVLAPAGGARNGKRTAGLDREICLGCGVCARACAGRCIGLVAREQRVITPLDTAHRVVVMAIERGKLQDLIFDNRALFSHRAMAAILGVILKLPPVKQVMASRQMKSRYLEALLVRIKPGAWRAAGRG